MKIGMIASEVTPLAKTGGLADVIGALSAALERLGRDVCVIAPAYRSVLRGGFSLRETGIELSVAVADRSINAGVLETVLDKGVRAYLIRADRYFDREFLYGARDGDYSDNAERFVFFSRAALEFLRRQPVDVVHCHDWQAALAVVYLKTQRERYSEIGTAKTMLTIHNLGFQGLFDPGHWQLLNLDSRYFTPAWLEFYGRINFLKGGVVAADKITTVSPSYAQEIIGTEQGFGLEGVLKERAKDLIGILNGVDYYRWNPWTDPFLPCHYGEHSLIVKSDCKKALQRAVGLPDQSEAPLIAMISRLTSQKGLDLVESSFDALIARGVQFVVLGSGEPRTEQFLRDVAGRYPQRVAVEIAFNEALAHQIEAGADFFLMPSRYEPCGLNQMYSLKYATIPIVRAVGGLRDSVEDYDARRQTGTGFVFVPYEGAAMLDAIDRSLAVYRDPEALTALRQRAMAADFSWERSAKLYSNLYEQLVH
jgi:starch synthase